MGDLLPRGSVQNRELSVDHVEQAFVALLRVPQDLRDVDLQCTYVRNSRSRRYQQEYSQVTRDGNRPADLRFRLLYVFPPDFAPIRPSTIQHPHPMRQSHSTLLA